MLDSIIKLLLHKGYKYLDDSVKDVFFRECEQHICVVTLGSLMTNRNVQFYNMIQRKLEWSIVNRYAKKVKFLHLIISEYACLTDENRTLLDYFTNIWLIEENTGKLYVYERQITDFDNLRVPLEKALIREKKSEKKKQSFHLTPVNTGIVLLNVLILIGICVYQRDILAVYDSNLMLSMGALSYETFMNGAWYQLITSFFLHFGFPHLVNNMILLLYTGSELERRIGSLTYLIMYFGFGIIGNLTSLIYYHGQGTQVVSAGASGAIFGVIGALFVVLVIRQIQTPELSPFRLMFMIVITIYYGMTSNGVDNAAHIGGLLAGFIGGFFLSKISQYGKLE